MSNQETVLDFSPRLEAIWLQNASNYFIGKRTIVSNVGERSAKIMAKPVKELKPRMSTILQDVAVDNADSLVLIHIPKRVNLGKIYNLLYVKILLLISAQNRNKLRYNSMCARIHMEVTVQAMRFIVTIFVMTRRIILRWVFLIKS